MKPAKENGKKLTPAEMKAETPSPKDEDTLLCPNGKDRVKCPEHWTKTGYQMELYNDKLTIVGLVCEKGSGTYADTNKGIVYCPGYGSGSDSGSGSGTDTPYSDPVTACERKKEGDTCSWKSNGYTYSGTCAKTFTNVLECKKKTRESKKKL